MAVAAAGVWSAIAAADAQEASLEYPIKATFLVRFGAYVEWPATAFATDTSPLQLCVAGRDPFGEILDELAVEERVGERQLSVRRLGAGDDPGSCHIVYVARPNAQETLGLLEQIDGQPVLVVTDAAQNAGPRGAIHFVVVDDRVRFHIDEAAADRNRLRLSSQLLSVALTVHREGDP